MTVDLLLFDLDETLVRTSDLEVAFRGRAYLGRQPQDYVERLRAAYNQRPFRIVYNRQLLERIRLLYPGVRIGVFTRAPSHYAEVVLGLAYPGLHWDIVVAYEDVLHTKPKGDGILAAMQRLGIMDVQNVWMVGDEKVDIQAAYDAGCRVVLDCSTWPSPKRREDWWAEERMPDAVITSPDDLIRVFAYPSVYLPIAECFQQGNFAVLEPTARMGRWNSFDLDGQYHPINYLGRHFTREAPRRADWHQVTVDIHEMKDSMTIPDYWVQSINLFLTRWRRYHPLLKVVVTVIPAKPGRVRRLEAMLAQLQAELGSAWVSFIPDIMFYLPGAQSHHGEGLNKQQRMENVRDNLRVSDGFAHAGRHLIVIDDVSTTGASLVYARRYLLAAGAADVTCLSLTKAVSNQ